MICNIRCSVYTTSPRNVCLYMYTSLTTQLRGLVKYIETPAYLETPLKIGLD